MVDDGAEDRERAVAVVDELHGPGLLGPVDVGGRVDLPEAAGHLGVPRPGVGRDGVAVGVPVDPEHDVREPQQQLGQLGTEHPARARVVVHRPDGVVREQHEQPVVLPALHDVPRLVEVVPAALLELLGEPGQLGLVDRPLGAAERVHRVERDAADPALAEGVVGVAGRDVPRGVAVPVRGARGLEVLRDGLGAAERPPVGVGGDRSRRSAEQGLEPRRVVGDQLRRQLADVHARGQVDDLRRPRRDLGHQGTRGDVALDQPVVVAEDRHPRHAQALGAERSPAGVQQPRDPREAGLADPHVRRLAGRWAVGVPVVDVVRRLVGHALVLVQVARVRHDPLAVQQVDLPAELVVLGVVDVVAGRDGEGERQPGHRSAPDPAQGPDGRLRDVGREHVLGAVGALEREHRGERRALVVEPVEELHPGGGLGVHQVHVGELAHGEDAAPPGAAGSGHPFHQVVADQMWLAGADHDLAVAVVPLVTLEQRPLQGGAAPVGSTPTRLGRVNGTGAHGQTGGGAGPEQRPAGQAAVELAQLDRLVVWLFRHGDSLGAECGAAPPRVGSPGGAGGGTVVAGATDVARPTRRGRPREPFPPPRNGHRVRVEW